MSNQENKISTETVSTENLPKATKRNTTIKSKKIKKTENIPRGLPKSGRPWKTPKQKFSSIKKTIHRNSLQKKTELRNEIRHIKELSKSIKDAKKEANELKKQRRLQNAERRLENERRSEVVQVIKNPAKLRRMKKKHMRMIEKRDLDKVKAV
ncbi:coiled-coil domain-containing protein 86 [Episyrphus balteatus]|uniref:coiled-coil domain-containing protein 86 n=1 Tax=Episyrphus balteatus TaxID=286459 RepID=UPI0024855B74|nr:coiled-coil domain-containing protein 86 [Episyrphus balteatus]